MTLDAEDARDLTANVTLSLEGRALNTKAIAFAEGKGCAQIRVDDPQLWWPAGMGEQPLYEVTVLLVDGKAVSGNYAGFVKPKHLELKRPRHTV